MNNIKLIITNNIEKQFDKIARQLFNETILVVNAKQFFITEIEFYVHNDKYHPDPYVHKNDMQLTSNRWYFHGSGVDITIGDKTKMVYGGILIRGLKEIVNQKENKFKYFDGPLNLLREIFSHILLSNSNMNFGLTSSEKIENKIVKSKRIGLNPRGDEEKEKYAEKKYRYLIDLVVAHKYKDKEKVKTDHVVVN